MDRVTLEDIDAAEGALKNIRVALSRMGREIFKMRHAKEMPSQYNFSDYERGNFAGTNYVNQQGPDWGVGTPIISLIYFWSHGGGGEEEVVTMPLRYLVIDDWRDEEQCRIDKAMEIEAERRNAASEQAAREREERERAQYAKLKEKYERA